MAEALASALAGLRFKKLIYNYQILDYTHFHL